MKKDSRQISFCQYKTNQRDTWNDLVMQIFRDLKLRFAIKRKYPKMIPKYLTSKKKYLESRSGALIGELGWNRQEPYQFVSKRTQRAALIWLQERFDDYVVSKNWEFRVILDPFFLSDTKPLPLSEIALGSKNKASCAVVNAEPQVPESKSPLVVAVGHDLMKVKYPSKKLKTDFIAKEVGDGWTFSIQGLRRPSGYVELPYGPMCSQLELWAYNVYRQTKLPYIAFDYPKEVCEQIGYISHAKNYRKLCRKIQDIVWTAQRLSKSQDALSEVQSVEPFLWALLWDSEPAKVISYQTKDGKQVTRRQVGRRKLSIDEQQMWPSVIFLNPVWIQRAEAWYQKVDLMALNKLVGSPLAYNAALKCYEIGMRPGNGGGIPLWGEKGLVAEFQKDKSRRRDARKDIKAAFPAAFKAIGAPFYFEGDLLMYWPWNPFEHDRPKLIDIPDAMKHLPMNGLDIDEIKRLRRNTIKLLEQSRKKT